MSDSHQRPTFSCDTLISVTGEGPDRRSIFGKNSDRPWNEAQPLELVGGGGHPAGSTVRCQALTIPEAKRTLTVLGSRPWWLWGYEHGLNEAGVVIGNEAIYTRDTVPLEGLLGMDLVRLGLERGATAAAAKQVITDHIETFGQGGAAIYLSDSPSIFRYFNSFLIADAREAFVLETSGRHWVSKRTTESVAIANLLTIEDDWDECSDGIEVYARQRGWWTEPANRRFDFRAAFEDRSMRSATQARYAASCRFLGSADFGLSQMMRHLRDHFEGGTVHVPDAETGESRPRSICLHPEEWGAGTVASMVVDLNAGDEPPVAWCSMATPCIGSFIPVPVGEDLPLPLAVAGSGHDERSLWWLMHELTNECEVDPATLTPLIQEVMLPWETELLAAVAANRRPPLAEVVATLQKKRVEALAKLPVTTAR